jgi:hypothetical protein
LDRTFRSPPRRATKSDSFLSRSRPDTDNPVADGVRIKRVWLIAAIARREDHRYAQVVHYPGRNVDWIVHIEYTVYAKTAIDYTNVLIDTV